MNQFVCPSVCNAMEEMLFSLGYSRLNFKKRFPIPKIINYYFFGSVGTSVMLKKYICIKHVLFPPINLLLISMSALQLTIRYLWMLSSNVESKAILHLGIITPDKILISYVRIAVLGFLKQ